MTGPPRTGSDLPPFEKELRDRLLVLQWVMISIRNNRFPYEINRCLANYFESFGNGLGMNDSIWREEALKRWEFLSATCPALSECPAYHRVRTLIEHGDDQYY